MKTSALLLALAACSLSACSESGGAGGTPEGDSGGVPGKPYGEFMGYDWTVEPGVEAFYCVYQTLTEDLWITDFRSIAPEGTHHVTLGFSDPGPPDGVLSSLDATADPPCTGIGLGNNLAYFGGVGTNPVSLPEGVAVKIPAGKQVQLNLHFYNTGDTPLQGRSGIELVQPEPSAVVHEAEVILVGKFLDLAVPPGESTHDALCTMVDDVNVFAVAPHMHWTGKHLSARAVAPSGEAVPLIDTSYAFEQQPYTWLEPTVPIDQGGKIEVTCDYANPGSDTLPFGESTDSEMCILFTYRYPAIADNLLCFQ